MKKFIFTTLLAVCGNSYLSNAQMVVSGVNVANNSAEFFCSLVDTTSTSFQPFCGAALIAPQWVLTAGHCAIDFNFMQPAVAIDVVIHPYYRNAPNGTYTRIRSEKVIPHQQFNLLSGSLEYDIALIKLKTPVPGAQVLGLPAQGSNTLNMPGSTVYVMGYGVFDTLNQGIQPDTLQMAEIEVISNDICNEPLRYAGAVMPSMICAGKITGHSKGGGAGDSGGPLFAVNGGQKTQVGVVSWGNSAFSTTMHPGIYTRISSYRTWIDSVINANSSTPVPQINKPVIPVISQAAGSVMITFPESIKEPIAYTIYNTAGQTLLKGNLEKGAVQATITTENFANGLYLVHVYNGTGFSYAGKFMRSL